MNDNKVFLDTNICIYILQWNEKYTYLLNNEIYISFITELELLSYKDIDKNEIDIIYKFLLGCNIIDINNEIKENTISFRREYWLKLPDSIIMASAKYIWIQLITNDQKIHNIK